MNKPMITQVQEQGELDKEILNDVLENGVDTEMAEKLNINNTELNRLEDSSEVTTIPRSEGDKILSEVKNNPLTEKERKKEFEKV